MASRYDHVDGGVLDGIETNFRALPRKRQSRPNHEKLSHERKINRRVTR